MRKFTATFRVIGIPNPLNTALFPIIFSPDDIIRNDHNKTVATITTVFQLNDDEIARMRTRITDPALSRLLTQWDKPAKIVALYLRQYYDQPPSELVNVTEIPEVLPEELKDAPDLALNSVTFTPHAPHQFYCPGNPGLSDPWARGW